jgi:hypothetical protein
MYTLLDYYRIGRQQGDYKMIGYVVFNMLIGKFLHWSMIETNPLNQGTIVETGLNILLFLFIGISVVGLLVVNFWPLYMCFKAKHSQRITAAQVHWNGALNKSLKDLAKAVKDGKQYQHEAKIFLKEVQVHCALKWELQAINLKLQGVFSGMDIDLDLELALKEIEGGDWKNLTLALGKESFTRSFNQID